MSGVMSRMYHGETNINFIGRRKQWFAISAVLVLASLGALLFKELNYGIEFEGGAQF
ncbi:MAG: protein translocase subunit SecF, partial [Actinobacteria bacterium]|nr:protein translocase subunit SecF [Actinomycetota bacterium]